MSSDDEEALLTNEVILLEQWFEVAPLSLLMTIQIKACMSAVTYCRRSVVWQLCVEMIGAYSQIHSPSQLLDLNPLTCSGVRQLHLKVFNAIQT